MAETATDKGRLRECLRRSRRRYTGRKRWLLAHRFRRQGLRLRRYRRLALFHPLSEEVPIIPLLRHLRRSAVGVWLPLIQGRYLRFRRAPVCQQFYKKHPLGMQEPTSGYAIGVNGLRCVVVPLTGFDRHGRRLGMGAGYYDRTLAKAHRTKVRRVGIAFDSQRIHRVPVESFDVRLHALISDRRYYRFRP